MAASALSIAPFLQKIDAVILNPLIRLAFAIALIYFLWGVFQFVSNTEDIKARDQGKTSMVWGIIGMFIMFSVFEIIKIVLASIGVTITGTFPF